MQRSEVGNTQMQGGCEWGKQAGHILTTMETAVNGGALIMIDCSVMQQCNSSDQWHTQMTSAPTYHILVRAWSTVLCQAGCKSPYITVIGCTAVTKAPYDRLEPLCGTGALLPITSLWDMLDAHSRHWIIPLKRSLSFTELKCIYLLYNCFSG